MKSNRGFTLIELLIVIALLGALAVGLIGAIDPFEQLKKGRDTGTRDLVSQVQTAIIRYYSVKNAMPFATDPTSTDLQTAPMGPLGAGAIKAMMDAGELRADFNTIQAGSLTSVWTSGTGAVAGEQPTAVVCYQPTSKSFANDPNTKYTKAGVLADGVTAGQKCLGTGAGTDVCYWCIQ
jgi:prepilin-type N-terminal cleavage/methylation domain-containing protein